MFLNTEICCLKKNKSSANLLLNPQIWKVCFNAEKCCLIVKVAATWKDFGLNMKHFFSQHGNMLPQHKKMLPEHGNGCFKKKMLLNMVKVASRIEFFSGNIVVSICKWFVFLLPWNIFFTTKVCFNNYKSFAFQLLIEKMVSQHGTLLSQPQKLLSQHERIVVPL